MYIHFIYLNCVYICGFTHAYMWCIHVSKVHTCHIYINCVYICVFIHACMWFIHVSNVPTFHIYNLRVQVCVYTCIHVMYTYFPISRGSCFTFYAYIMMRYQKSLTIYQKSPTVCQKSPTSQYHVGGALEYTGKYMYTYTYVHIIFVQYYI